MGTKPGWRRWAVLGALAAGMAGRAGAETTADLPVLSAYVWRGQVLNDEPVVQPALNVSTGGFAVNVWANRDATDRRAGDAGFSEVDLTASYGRTFGAVALAGGLIEYLFPGSGAAATREAYLSAALPDAPVVPGLCVYRDLDQADGVYASLSLSRDFALGHGETLTVATSLGAADRFYNAFYFGVRKDALNDATASASLAWTLSDRLTLTPGIRYACLLDPGLRDGARASFGSADNLLGSLSLSVTL